MTSIYIWAATHWKSLVVATLAFLLGFYIGEWDGYYKGIKYGRDQLKSEIAIQTLEVKEKQNEIRNNRPDDGALVNSLLNGTY